MTPDSENLLIRLRQYDVKFVLIGGWAGTLYGCTRTTHDIDICGDFTPENLLRLQDAVAELHPVHRMNPRRPALILTKENCKDFKNLNLDTDLGQLDFLGIVNGIGNFNQAKAASQKMRLGDVEFRILTLDALIISKEAMNRPQDIADVKQLEAIKKLKGD